jgi:hypothetical protein
MKQFSLAPPVILFIAFLLAGCNAEADQVMSLKDKPSSGIVTIDRNDIAIGVVEMSEGKMNTSYKFRNVGGEPVVLLEGASSCMCTEGVVKSSDGTMSPRIKMPGHGPVARIFQVLDPGEEAELIVTFDPNAHGPQGVGPFMREITITTNSTETPKVTFRLRGNVVP